MKRPKTTWTKERIQALISENPLALERALLVVYANQTQDEKASGDTHHDNGEGFTGADAKFLSSVAEWVKNSRYREGFRLTPSQREAVRPLMLKYWRQIQRVIIYKEALANVQKTNLKVREAEAVLLPGAVSAAHNDQVGTTA